MLLKYRSTFVMCCDSVVFALSFIVWCIVVCYLSSVWSSWSLFNFLDLKIILRMKLVQVWIGLSSLSILLPMRSVSFPLFHRPLNNPWSHYADPWSNKMKSFGKSIIATKRMKPWEKPRVTSPGVREGHYEVEVEVEEEIPHEVQTDKPHEPPHIDLSEDEGRFFHVSPGEQSTLYGETQFKHKSNFTIEFIPEIKYILSKYIVNTLWNNVLQIYCELIFPKYIVKLVLLLYIGFVLMINI